jgi:hypothetical protein
MPANACLKFKHVTIIEETAFMSFPRSKKETFHFAPESLSHCRQMHLSLSVEISLQRPTTSEPSPDSGQA